MAGPSSLSTNDSLFALRLQLFEAGAGDVSINALLDLPQHAPPRARFQRDLSLACELTCEDLSLHRDSLCAQNVACKNQSIPDVMLSNVAIPPFSCPICLELCPAATRFQTPCGHHFCAICIRRHLTLIATETKKFPLTCPSCHAQLDPQQCLDVLTGTQAYRDLEKLVMEKLYHVQLRYCANENCAVAFDWDDDELYEHYTDRYRVNCPLCQRATCVNCRVLWHENKSCEQFQQERQGRDLMVRLAQREQWTACPDCGQVIERQRGDCYFVRCRCGCGFCHRCGTKYLSQAQRRENVHGTPGCRCGLFGDEEEEDRPQYNPPPRYNPPLRINRQQQYNPPLRINRQQQFMEPPPQAHLPQYIEPPAEEELFEWSDEEDFFEPPAQREIAPPVQAQLVEPPAQAQLVEPPAQAQLVEPPAQEEFVEPPGQEELVEPPVQPQLVEPPAQAELIEPPAQAQLVEQPTTEELNEPPAQAQLVEPPAIEELIEPPAQEELIDAQPQAQLIEPPAQEESVEPPAQELNEPPALGELVEPPVQAPLVETPAQAELIEPPAQAQLVELPIQKELVEPPVQAPLVEPPAQAELIEPPAQVQLVEQPTKEELNQPPAQAQLVEAPAKEELTKPPAQELIDAQAQAQLIEPPAQEESVEPSAQEELVEPPAQEELVEPPVQAPLVETPAQVELIEPPAQAQLVEQPAKEELNEPPAQEELIEPQTQLIGSPTQELNEPPVQLIKPPVGPASELIEPSPLLQNTAAKTASREMLVSTAERRRNTSAREDFEEVVEGPNGFLALRSWLKGAGTRRKRLPGAMKGAVQKSKCPYKECGKKFAHLRALEQHLVNVKTHDVFLCCGRPFAMAEALEQHTEAVH